MGRGWRELNDNILYGKFQPTTTEIKDNPNMSFHKYSRNYIALFWVDS